MRTNALVPGRFLTLSAHVVLLVTLIWVHDENIRACAAGLSEAPRDFIGLSLAQYVLRVSLDDSHCAATVALTYFVVAAVPEIRVLSVLPAFIGLSLGLGDGRVRSVLCVSWSAS
ncbi:hypothetical protein HPB52_020869 [Rhipicephalus sanguineus]|uniref:Transmembrane protein 107 n=1 Tax=Rhipicephalus sanguineus TaxID=34632 RepID=A0A9D4Q7T0_RHISA|nr:hypothetical protein HPB52_020869 [Rhipicephalus sanguineus]